MKNVLMKTLALIVILGIICLAIIFGLRNSGSIKEGYEKKIAELEYKQFQRDSIIASQNKVLENKAKEKDSIVNLNNQKIYSLSKVIVNYQKRIGDIQNMSQGDCKDSVINILGCQNDSLLYCMAYESVLNLGKCKVENDTLNYTIKNKDAEISFDEFKIGALKMDTALLRLNITDEKTKGKLVKEDLEQKNKEVKKQLFWTRIGAVTVSSASIILLIVSL